MFCEKENCNNFTTNIWDVVKHKSRTSFCPQVFNPCDLGKEKPVYWPIANSSGSQPNALKNCVQNWDVEEEVHNELYDLIDVTPFNQRICKKTCKKTQNIDFPRMGKKCFNDETFSTFGEETSNLPVTNACHQLTQIADKLQNTSLDSIRSIGDEISDSRKQYLQDLDLEEEDFEELYDLIDITPLKKILQRQGRGKKRRKICKKVLQFEDGKSRIYDSSTKRGRQTRHPDRYKPVEKVASIPKITEVSEESSSEESCCDDSSFEG